MHILRTVGATCLAMTAVIFNTGCGQTPLSEQSDLEGKDKTLPVLTGWTNGAAVDQDDVCIWRDPHDPSRSLVFASDKGAGRVFVYDLEGRVMQSVSVAKPGNIDLRDSFPLNATKQTLVVVNSRGDNQLIAFVLDDQRQLVRIDNGKLKTHQNYGGGLLHSAKDGQFYFFATSKTDGVQQWHLFDDGDGHVGGRIVRSWPFPICEGLVGDDANGNAYLSVETKGIYRLSGDPQAPAPPQHVIRIGQDGFQGDSEGIVLLRTDRGVYLIVSDQTPSRFRVYRQTEDYPYLGSFGIDQVTSTDGFEIQRRSLGPAFPHGLFVCHSDLDDGRTLRVANAGAIVEWIEEASGIPRDAAAP